MAVNGFEHSFQQIELIMDGRRWDMFKDISYKGDVKKNNLNSSDGRIVGNTQGKLETDGSISMLRSQFKTFRRWLLRGKPRRTGITQVFFDIQVIYGSDDSQETDELTRCTLNGIDVKNSDNTDPLYITCGLSIQGIRLDGDEIITQPERFRLA